MFEVVGETGQPLQRGLDPIWGAVAETPRGEHRGLCSHRDQATADESLR